MKAQILDVDINNAENIFKDPQLVGKVLSVKTAGRPNKEYVVIGKYSEENSLGLQMAGVITRNDKNSRYIDTFTAELLPGQPLHFALAESVCKGQQNYDSYDSKLREAGK